MFFEKFKRKIQALINIYHLFMAILANIYYGFPGRKLTVIGVSGTDGKTTTTHLIHHVLKSHSNKSYMTSSISASGLHTTTPNSFRIQKLLKETLSNKGKYFVIESTSHALDQNRLWGIKFEVSAITNITFEHLDYHINYLNYIKTKAKLLINSKISIINKDDKSYEILAEHLTSKKTRYLTYSLLQKADFNFDSNKELGLNLAEFNNYNYLAAYSVLKSLNLSDEIITNSFKSFRLPEGRLEKIYDKEFKVIIDFAHTPNSFKNILKEVSKYKKNRLIHIFGSAGLRDSQKRPFLGKISSGYSDVIILTEEDYRTEDVNKINEEIETGINKNLNLIKPEDLNKNSKNVYSKITDRQQAIKKAISIAIDGDVLLFTGKSHEKSLARGKKEYPWSESATIKKFLQK